MKKTFLIIFICSFIACNSNQNQRNSIDSTSDSSSLNQINKIDSFKKESYVDSSVNVQRGDEIHISFSPNSDSILVKGHLDSAGASVICYLSITNEKKISAKIETLKIPANIRFNQIVFPNKQSNGPFGQKLDYDLTQKGTYKIIIGSSLMAENPYKGEFLLHLKLK